MASSVLQTTLSGATTAAGTTIDFTDARRAVTMVLVPSGLITSGLVAMEASQDGINWVIVYVFDPVIRTNQFYNNTNGAFRYWRGNITLPLVGGGSVSATFMEADR